MSIIPYRTNKRIEIRATMTNQCVQIDFEIVWKPRSKVKSTALCPDYHGCSRGLFLLLYRLMKHLVLSSGKRRTTLTKLISLLWNPFLKGFHSWMIRFLKSKVNHKPWTHGYHLFHDPFCIALYDIPTDTIHSLSVFMPDAQH